MLFSLLFCQNKYEYPFILVSLAQDAENNLLVFGHEFNKNTSLKDVFMWKTSDDMLTITVDWNKTGRPGLFLQ